jgi:hypothetical protein
MCQICYDYESTLNVHHRCYLHGKDPWEYSLEAIVTLCESCHEEEAPERAEAVAGMRHLRNFAGYCVSIPHKAMAARQCDELLPNTKAGSMVNTVRIDLDCRLIKGKFEEGPYLRLEARC